MLIDKKTYDSTHRESLFNITVEFGTPKKLIIFTKMCLEKTPYQIRVNQTFFNAFTAETGFKLRDKLLPMFDERGY